MAFGDASVDGTAEAAITEHRTESVVVVVIVIDEVDRIWILEFGQAITVVVREVAQLEGAWVGVLVLVVAVVGIVDVAARRSAGDDAVATAIAVTVEVGVPRLRVRGVALVDVAVTVVVDPVAELRTGRLAALLVLFGRGASVDLLGRLRDRGGCPFGLRRLFSFLDVVLRLLFRDDLVVRGRAGGGDNGEKKSGQNATHDLFLGPWP